MGTSLVTTVGQAPPLRPASESRREMRDLLQLSAPLIAGFTGSQLMGIVDTAMVGRLGSLELAAVSIGTGLYFACSVFGMGCVLGMDPLVSQAIGAREGARARAVLRAGTLVALMIGVPLTLLVAVIGFALEPLGLSPALASEARWYVWGRLPNILPFLVFAAQRSYLQARGAGRPIVLVMVVANVANVIGNTILIFGDGGLTAMGLPAVGLPALGVFGAGLASGVAGIASMGVAHLALRRLPALPEGEATTTGSAPSARSVLALGVPIGLTMLAEVGAFATASVLAGRLGPVAGAAHQVAITIASFTFTTALGIGAATSVRVGQAVGRGETLAARASGFAGLKASSALMGISALSFLAFAEPLTRVLTDRPEVVAAAIPLVHIAAVFQLADGAQAVAAGALRGAADTRFVTYANVAGYYAFGLPVAVVLAFPMGMGAAGLWWGLCAGLIAVAAALIGRFHVLTSRAVARA